MAGLDPAIREAFRCRAMDDRDRPGHRRPRTAETGDRIADPLRPAVVASGGADRDLVRRRPAAGDAGHLGIARRPALRLGDRRHFGARRASPSPPRSSSLAGWWAAAPVAKASGIEDPGCDRRRRGRRAMAGAAGGAARSPGLGRSPSCCSACSTSGSRGRSRWADRTFKAGFGIMLDDLLAAVYAALVLSVLLAIGGAFGVRP